MLLLSANAFSQSQTSSSDVPRCAADIRWLNTNGSLTYARSSEAAEDLSFLVHLSRGTGCTDAEVTVTATYLTDGQSFICSGTVRSAMTVSSQVQTRRRSANIRPTDKDRGGRSFALDDQGRIRRYGDVRNVVVDPNCGNEIGKDLGEAACSNRDLRADADVIDDVRSIAAVAVSAIKSIERPRVRTVQIAGPMK